MNFPPNISIDQTSIDDQNFSNFTYTERNISPIADISTEESCCSCTSDCTLGTCSCIQSRFGQLFDQASSRLLPLALGLEFEGPIFECSPSCACRGNCSNAITLNATFKPSLSIKKVPNKGLGVFSVQENIPSGTFICEYAGELLRGQEAAERLRVYDGQGQGHALLVIREVLPSGNSALVTYIDATKIGNIARFINHRCGGGNLSMILSRSPGALLPRACLFANCDIQKGEELTFAYGPANPTPSKTLCHCGSPACLGFMPHEET